MADKVNIYITETHILVQQSNPKEEHALIGPYNKTTLYYTIASFPELKHDLPIHTFINSKKEVVETVCLKTFAELNNLDYQRVKSIIQHPGNLTKGWMFIPKDEEVPEAFYNWHMQKKQKLKKAYANSFSVKKY